jgi:RNA polymerase sigma-70 factor, ECF subfamily
LRRRAWQHREVVLDPEAWTAFPDRTDGAQDALERRQVLDALRAAIDSCLTPHQRQVFVALALNEVPIDVLAQRLGTTRGALYEALREARLAIRSGLLVGGGEALPAG